MSSPKSNVLEGLREIYENSSLASDDPVVADFLDSDEPDRTPPSPHIRVEVVSLAPSRTFENVHGQTRRQVYSGLVRLHIVADRDTDGYQDLVSIEGRIRMDFDMAVPTSASAAWSPVVLVGFQDGQKSGKWVTRVAVLRISLTMDEV